MAEKWQTISELAETTSRQVTQSAGTVAAIPDNGRAASIKPMILTINF